VRDSPILQALASASPDASVFIAGPRAWSASQVREGVEALAPSLAQGRVVAVLADNSPVWAIADLACLHSGVVHLPLPGFFTPAQWRHSLEQTGADTVLTEHPQAIRALELGFEIESVSTLQGLTLMRRRVRAASLPEGTCKISYTSGSTGQPKGVCLSAQGLADTALAVKERLADLPLQQHLAVLPLALLLENVAGVYAPLLRGVPVHLPGLSQLGWQGIGRMDFAGLQACAQESRAHSLILVPELLKAWMTWLAYTGQQAPAPLRYVAVGGAPVPAALLAQARALGLPAYQGYGLTECGSVVSLNRPGDEGNDVGRPLGHVHIRLKGDEVYVRSRAFLGYLGQVRPEDDEFATGDLGRWGDAGHLQLTGRRKHLIINSYGRNIAPEWVESTLLAQPAISQAVVYGEGQPHLSALLVVLPGLGAERVARAVQAANAGLPEYARVQRYAVVPPFNLAEGTATGSGRPVRAAILQRYAAALTAD
jgi:long-chain acyl-CoA synthetase